MTIQPTAGASVPASNPGQYLGSGESVVNDLTEAKPHHAKATMRLIRRATRGAWKPSESLKQVARGRLEQLVKSDDDELANAAIKTLVAMDQADIRAMAAAAAVENPQKSAVNVNIGIQVGEVSKGVETAERYLSANHPPQIVDGSAAGQSNSNGMESSRRAEL